MARTHVPHCACHSPRPRASPLSFSRTSASEPPLPPSRSHPTPPHISVAWHSLLISFPPMHVPRCRLLLWQLLLSFRDERASGALPVAILAAPTSVPPFKQRRVLIPCSWPVSQCYSVQLARSVPKYPFRDLLRPHSCSECCVVLGWLSRRPAGRAGRSVGRLVEGATGGPGGGGGSRTLQGHGAGAEGSSRLGWGR